MFRAVFVETYNKRSPFREFILGLNLDEQADIFAAIDKLCYLKDNNVIIPQRLSKYIREGIYELRVHHKDKISRSFYFYYINQQIVFTHGFIKKTEKTPIKEIEKAIKLKNEYKSIMDK